MDECPQCRAPHASCHTCHLELVRIYLRVFPRQNMGTELCPPVFVHFGPHTWGYVLVCLHILLFRGHLANIPNRVGLFVIQSAHLAYDLYKTSPVGVGVIHFQFILNNVFHLAFILLLVNSFFVAAELVLLLNLVNLRILYFRHPVCRLLIRTATMSGPLAWTIVAMDWNGSMMVPDPISTACRVASQISTWGIFACGVIFAFAHQVWLRQSV